MRAYIDTNILVDLILARQEFLPDAQRVFALGYAGEVQLTVSALSFVNTVYLARKYKYTVFLGGDSYHGGENYVYKVKNPQRGSIYIVNGQKMRMK